MGKTRALPSLLVKGIYVVAGLLVAWGGFYAGAMTGRDGPATEQASVLKVDHSVDRFLDNEKVILFSLETCPICESARVYLNQRGVAYVEHDVKKNQDAKLALDELGISFVPVVVAGERAVVGFDPVLYEELLKNFAPSRVQRE